MAFTTTSENLESGDIRVISFTGGATNDNSDPLGFAPWGDVCVQALGTFGGATVTIQGSNDGGTTWATLNNAQGTVATFTAAGIKQIVERPLHMRAAITGGAGVSVSVIFVLRRAQQLRV